MTGHMCLTIGLLFYSPYYVTQSIFENVTLVPLRHVLDLGSYTCEDTVRAGILKVQTRVGLLL